MSYRSDVRKLIREMHREGWTHEITGGTHVRLIHPSGRLVTCGMTPSCYRWEKNVRADIKRLVSEIEG